MRNEVGSGTGAARRAPGGRDRGTTLAEVFAATDRAAWRRAVPPHIPRCKLLLGFAFGVAVAAHAQTSPPSKPPSCSAPEYRQFDFWQGDWDVFDPSGKIVGRNRIVAIHGGCALQENWSGASGHAGTSLNIFDIDRKRWHQTWVDSNGGLLQLDGGIVDGAMVLRGEAISDTPPKTTLQRITWTPQRDGRVRQLWESSSDGGKKWDVVFDGMYSKRR